MENLQKELKSKQLQLIETLNDNEQLMKDNDEMYDKIGEYEGTTEQLKQQLSKLLSDRGCLQELVEEKNKTADLLTTELQDNEQSISRQKEMIQCLLNELSEIKQYTPTGKV